MAGDIIHLSLKLEKYSDAEFEANDKQQALDLMFNVMSIKNTGKSIKANNVEKELAALGSKSKSWPCVKALFDNLAQSDQNMNSE